MGGTGEENVSVIVARSPPGGFRLDRFGDARNQAEWLLGNVLAPPNSGEDVGALRRVHAVERVERRYGDEVLHVRVHDKDGRLVPA